ncbi:MAG TPA: DUF1223 domain-containing protein [Vicinamibacterales bacterium]|nr:DUF1223 domain-containing protein [Vicinamibacterales bacterium]
MTRSSAAVLALAVAVGAGVTLAARAPRPAPSAPIPVVVELFTSEGCSSCPPADAALIDLLEHQPIAGVQVIGLSEHVDYWDRQGWKDPFSDHLFTQRQQGYATAAGSTEVFTPQMFVDGGAPFVGSDRAAALAAIRLAASQPKPGIDLNVSGGSAYSVAIAPSRALAGAQVWLAIVEDGLASKVTGGENSGRALRHAAVTRRLTSLGKTGKDGAFAHEGRLDLDPRWKLAALHAIVIVQPGSFGRIAAARSVPLGV